MFEERIYTYLKDHGIKMTWVARKANMNYKRLFSCLTGKLELKASELATICNILGLSMDRLSEENLENPIKEGGDA